MDVAAAREWVKAGMTDVMLAKTWRPEKLVLSWETPGFAVMSYQRVRYQSLSVMCNPKPLRQLQTHVMLTMDTTNL